MRKIAAGLTAALMTALLGFIAPTVASATTAAGVQGTNSVTWGSCSDPSLIEWGGVCGYLSVPLNYKNPSGPKIKIALSMIRHTSSAKNYRGVLLTDPGGPGATGLYLPAQAVAQLDADNLGPAAADYDWVGFDPRGVGSSKPALSCEPNYISGVRQNYDPTTKAILRYWLSRTKAYDRACENRSAEQLALLRNMTTVDSVRDMNSIRKALVGPGGKISQYGWSYGTDLAMVYATLYPHTLDKLILDSSVNPQLSGYRFNLAQDIAFERTINIWFRWLARYNSFYHLGATEAAVSKRWYAELTTLAKHPIDGVIGPDEWSDIFLQAAYYQLTWTELGGAFADWESTHGTDAASHLMYLYQQTDSPGNDNELAVYSAVECTDSQWPTKWSVWERDNTALNKVAPFETWSNAWFNAPCLYWPVPATRHPVRVASGGSGRAVRSALLIDQTLDGATPFAGSLAVRKLFVHSVLLAEPGGTSHAVSLFDGNLCVDRTIARYLLTGKLPPRKAGAEWDITCKPVPAPSPLRTRPVFSPG